MLCHAHANVRRGSDCLLICLRFWPSLECDRKYIGSILRRCRVWQVKIAEAWNCMLPRFEVMLYFFEDVKGRVEAYGLKVMLCLVEMSHGTSEFIWWWRLIFWCYCRYSKTALLSTMIPAPPIPPYGTIEFTWSERRGFFIDYCTTQYITGPKKRLAALHYCIEKEIR